MAVASRTTFPEGAFSLIDLYNWSDYFEMKEIYPGMMLMLTKASLTSDNRPASIRKLIIEIFAGPKYPHFEAFKNQTKVSYKDMLFFDDEHRNIRDIGSLNVTCVKVDSYVGMNWDYLKQGFEEHSKKIEKMAKEAN